MATTEEIIRDDQFNLSIKALKLIRSVEVYQWQETSESKTEKQVGGGEKTVVKYSYQKIWHQELINSDEFKKSEYKNPKTMPVSNRSIYASHVTLGAFDIPKELLSEMTDYTALNVDKGVANVQSELPNAKYHDGGYYIGDNPADPQIGDAIVRFETVNPAVVSIVAQQYNNTFNAYTTQSGGEILLLDYGQKSIGSMFSKARDENAMMTWGLRIVGFVLMAVGLGLLLRPLAVIADVLPILGSIVGAGTYFVAALSSLVLSLITIGISWVVFRPIVGVPLLFTAFVLAWVLKKRVSSLRNPIEESTEKVDDH
jgi:hypothetical protein